MQNSSVHKHALAVIASGGPLHSMDESGTCQNADIGVDECYLQLHDVWDLLDISIVFEILCTWRPRRPHLRIEVGKSCSTVFCS